MNIVGSLETLAIIYQTTLRYTPKHVTEHPDSLDSHTVRTKINFYTYCYRFLPNIYTTNIFYHVNTHPSSPRSNDGTHKISHCLLLRTVLRKTSTVGSHKQNYPQINNLYPLDNYKTHKWCTSQCYVNSTKEHMTFHCVTLYSPIYNYIYITILGL